MLLTKDEKIQTTVRVILALTLVVLFCSLFFPFTTPIIMACFVAFGCEPIIKKVNFKSKKRKYFTLLLFIALLILFLVPSTLFVLRIANGLSSLSTESMKSSQFLQAIFELWDKMQITATQVTHTLGLEQNVLPQKEELFAKFSPYILDKATLFLSSLPDLGLMFFVFFCFLFIFITNADQLKKITQNLNLLPNKELNYILITIQNSCYSILTSTFFIGALQALIVATGSLIFGYHEFFLIFVITFFSSFIPLLGAGPIAAFLAVVSFIMGNSADGIGLLVVTAIAGSIDNIIKPLIFSKDEEGLNPILSLLGIIGSISIFGLIGLLIGPLLLQITIKLVPNLVSEIKNTFSNKPHSDS